MVAANLWLVRCPGTWGRSAGVLSLMICKSCSLSLVGISVCEGIAVVMHTHYINCSVLVVQSIIRLYYYSYGNPKIIVSFPISVISNFNCSRCLLIVTVISDVS